MRIDYLGIRASGGFFAEDEGTGEAWILADDGFGELIALEGDQLAIWAIWWVEAACLVV